ncbi:MAG: PAS domain-containing protein [Alphaproteobacteria bacterium]|nr:PAS domain-containing protein [Alphaproteobacteria bacterium]
MGRKRHQKVALFVNTDAERRNRAHIADDGRAAGSQQRLAAYCPKLEAVKSALTNPCDILVMTPIEATISPGGDLPACDPRITGLYRYWQSIRPADAAFPGRQHFDPIAAKKFIPNIYLLDIHREPLRFRVRLMGSENVRLMDHDPTGQWLGEAFRPNFYNEPTYAQYRAAAESGLVGYHRGLPVSHLGGHFLIAERLLLPLAKNGRAVDMVLGFAVYHSPSSGPAAPPELTPDDRTPGNRSDRQRSVEASR